MGSAAGWIIWLMKKAVTRAPKRMNAAAAARSKGLPGNRTFVMQFKEAPNRALYFWFEQDQPRFSEEPRRYDAQIVWSIPALLQVLDGEMSFDEAIAWREVKVIPVDPREFTGYDFEAAKQLLKSFESTIREIIRG